MGSAGRLGALFNYGLVVGVLVALQVTGIDLSTRFAAGAILAVGLRPDSWAGHFRKRFSAKPTRE